MEPWIAILLPFALLLARISGFFVTLPIFSGQGIPNLVRVGLVLTVTVFFAAVTPPPAAAAPGHWLGASVLMVRELLCGLALGVSLRCVFLAIRAGGEIIAQQMGLFDASVIDPITAERSHSIAIFLETSFTMLFLFAGGHHVLLIVIRRSYQVFPVAQTPDPAALARAVAAAGAAMLGFALQLAGPMLAGFLIMTVILCVLARVLPEMNVLMLSFPVRVATGLFMAKQTMPFLESFNRDLCQWMSRFLQS